jgi:hypothetical protein
MFAFRPYVKGQFAGLCRIAVLLRKYGRGQSSVTTANDVTILKHAAERRGRKAKL